MNLAHEKIYNIDIIKVKGELTNSTAKKFSQSLSKYVVQNSYIIVDMSKCSFISNSGLRYLVLLNRDILSKWGKLALVGLNDNIIETINLTGFDNIFSIYPKIRDVFEIWKVGENHAKNR